MNKFVKEFNPMATDVAICGSMTHRSEMLEVIKQLNNDGITVSTPDFGAKPTDYDSMNQDQVTETKGFWTRRHFANISEAKVVLVVNGEKNGIKGYVGANTLLEMCAGYIFDKPIYILNPVSRQGSYEEIFGMKPVILNAELSRMELAK